MKLCHLPIQIAVLITLIFVHSFHGAFPSFASDYITIQEYETLHPNQVQKSKAFSEKVRAKGVPITRGVQTRPVTIAFIYPGEQISDYWRRSIESFKARMDEINLQYEINEFFTKPVVDYRIQEQLIRKSLKKHPDYLVFTLAINRHKRIIKRIITQQQTKLILQNITTPLRSMEGNQPFLYVGFDHIRGARMLAKYYLKKTGGKGSYALLYYSQGYISTMRGDSFVNALKHMTELKQVAAYYTNGDRNRSKQAAIETLNVTPGINFIYACSTDVALGAADAVMKKFPKNPVLINGWGGGSSELDAVIKGHLDVTVMRINDDNGVAMAEAIRMDLEGNKAIPQIYSGDFVLVEKGIPQEKLDQLKRRAFRYSGIGNQP